MFPLWKESPFIRLLFPIIFGILIYKLGWKFSVNTTAVICILILVSIFLFNRLKDFIQLKLAWVQGILFHFLILFCAILICGYHDVKNDKTWYGHSFEGYDYLLIQAKTPPEEKEKTYKIEAEIFELKNEHQSKEVKGTAFFYLQKNEKSQQIRSGNFLLVRNQLKQIITTGNPGAFDYAAYCANQNIYHTAFLKSSEWITVDTLASTISSFFQSLNQKSRIILEKYIKNPDALGIAEALLVGYRLDIDDTTWQAYTNTGIVHIIAISGMHMAMIYKSVLWLLLLIPTIKKNKKWAIILSVLLMWTFACITGLPASVVRAACMFSIIAFGDIQDKKSNTLNMLFASAFFMLCANPSFLFDVGFQLSFLAVLSLISFYQPIYEKVNVSNKLLDLAWQLTAVTLAAQILTFPICIFYFHQFPLLFLITNMVAVPLTTVILYLEILLICLSYFTSIGAVLGILINESILKLNEFVFYLSHLKFSVWSGIQINFAQTILLYIFLTLFVVWLKQKKANYFIYSLIIVFILSVSFMVQRIQIFRQNKIIVYNISKQKSLEFLYQNQYEFIADQSASISMKDSFYTLIPAHIFYQSQKNNIPLCAQNQTTPIELFRFQQKTIGRIESCHFNCETPIPLDILIISQKCEENIDYILKQINPKQIVIDASVPFWKIENWAEQLQSKNIPYHIVAKQGAFIMDI